MISSPPSRPLVKVNRALKWISFIRDFTRLWLNIQTYLEIRVDQVKRSHRATVPVMVYNNFIHRTKFKFKFMKNV